MRSIFPLLTALTFLAASPVALAAEPFLKPHDVIALVGGEDMVAMSEYGFLEMLLIRALPDYQLRFRSLAWEGDTVFEQRRDLNFPPLEEQLDKIGATVVIAQFGQMESLAGKEKLPEFIAAYEKLIARLSAGGKRRVVLISPTEFPPQSAIPIFAGLPTVVIEEPSEKGRVEGEYADAIRELASRLEVLMLPEAQKNREYLATRDGLHLSDESAGFFAVGIAQEMGGEAVERRLNALTLKPGEVTWEQAYDLEIVRARPLAEIIRAKNRLWFHYWRPQNWAFLNGDRINQPSSRDHLDPSKRWFPAEIEEFVPLIEAKEREIDALAVKLAQP